MKRKNQEDLEKEISKSVIQGLDDETLLNAFNFLNKFREYRAVKKLHGTYVNNVRESLDNTENGKIYVKYNLDGARTGRLSNSGYTANGKMGVSFHTLPRETKFNIRSYVIAPEDYFFATVDEKSMELRVLCEVANEEKMFKAFAEKLDLHSYSASLTFNKKMENVTKDERQLSKESSFLTIYGGTAYTLARKRNISEKRAEKVLEGWFGSFPGVRPYMEDTFQFIEDNGFSITLFGRRRNLPNVRSSNFGIVKQALRQGLNFTIQSLASDILVCSIIGIYQKIKARKLKSKIVATVHDSIEFLIHKDELDEMLAIIKSEMVDAEYMKKNFGMKFNTPFEIEVLLGKSFGDGEEIEINVGKVFR